MCLAHPRASSTAPPQAPSPSDQQVGPVGRQARAPPPERSPHPPERRTRGAASRPDADQVRHRDRSRRRGQERAQRAPPERLDDVPVRQVHEGVRHPAGGAGVAGQGAERTLGCGRRAPGRSGPPGTRGARWPRTPRGRRGARRRLQLAGAARRVGSLLLRSTAPPRSEIGAVPPVAWFEPRPDARWPPCSMPTHRRSSRRGRGEEHRGGRLARRCSGGRRPARRSG